MANKLTRQDTASMEGWTNSKLVDEFLYFSDYYKLIQTQDENGVANKNESDSNVLKLKNDYLTVKKAVSLRFPQQTDKLAELESLSNQLALYSHSGALGIPETEETKDSIRTLRTNLASLYNELAI